MLKHYLININGRFISDLPMKWYVTTESKNCAQCFNSLEELTIAINHLKNYCHIDPMSCVIIDRATNDAIQYNRFKTPTNIFKVVGSKINF